MWIGYLFADKNLVKMFWNYLLDDYKPGPNTRYWRYQPTWPRTKVIFDGKDDENLLYKTNVMTRFSTVSAAACSLMDICIFPRPVRTTR